MNEKDITGKTLINHSLRVKAGLTIAEYTVMIFSLEAERFKRAINKETVWRYLGIDFNLFVKLRQILVTKGYLTSSLKITDKWGSMIGNIDDMFNKFWAPITINETIYKWPGSKIDAKNKFEIALRTMDFEKLMKQKEYYFTVVNESSYDRQVMGAPVFLNPTTKRYEEDWYLQTKEGKKKLQESKQKSKTKEFDKGSFDNLIKD